MSSRRSWLKSVWAESMYMTGPPECSGAIWPSTQPTAKRGNTTSDRSCHGRCIRNSRANPASPGAPAPQPLSRHVARAAPCE